MSRHIVMYSGGIGSWATAKWVVDRYGPDDTTLLFADVGGMHTEPHLGEDPDNYRFINETAEKFGAELVTLNVGKTIYDVFKEDRMLGNSRIANCSKWLKQKPCRTWLNAYCHPATTTVYVGIDFTEIHRMTAIERNYQPFFAKAPMCDPPYKDKAQMLRDCRNWGVEPPRSYAEGWAHSNCQGACVRGGQAQWKKLLDLRPDAYAFHEGKEQELREFIDKDVSILKDRRGGTSTPLTLRSFREQQETGQGDLFETENDWGGCGCFVEAV